MASRSALYWCVTLTSSSYTVNSGSQREIFCRQPKQVRQLVRYTRALYWCVILVRHTWVRVVNSSVHQLVRYTRALYLCVTLVCYTRALYSCVILACRTREMVVRFCLHVSLVWEASANLLDVLRFTRHSSSTSATHMS